MAIPYARGVGYPGDTLAHLYGALAADKVLPRVFYEEAIGDLEGLVEYMRKALLFLVLTRQPVTIVGAAWFTNVTPYRANVGVWYHRSIQGELGRLISRRILVYCFHRYQWRHVWGFSPWRQAAQHGVKVGFKAIATLPEFVKVGARLRDLYVIRMDNTVCYTGGE